MAIEARRLSGMLAEIATLCLHTRRSDAGPFALPSRVLRGLFFFRFGVIAQLVERLNGIEEVWGSNPHGSTPREARAAYLAQRPPDSPGSQLLRYITE